MKDREYIERIIKYCEKINKYMLIVSSFEEFLTMDEKIDAVKMNLEQIGETTKKISDIKKNKDVEIEWKKIIGLRNVISHEYEGVSLKIIYDIVKEYIPNLLHRLKKNIEK